MTTPESHSAPDQSPRLPALCPYCGHGHELGPGKPRPLQCVACKGRFEPLSRQATQNAMGPWQVRDEAHPFRPPCSYETIVKLAERGKIDPTTIVRGPTTRQFWSYARDTPGVAAVLGFCHSCHTPIAAEDVNCPSCDAVLRPATDRQQLGLSPKAALPGEAPPEQIAAMIRPRTPQAMPATRVATMEVEASGARPAEPVEPARDHAPAARQEPVANAASVATETRGKRGLLKVVVGVQAVALVALAAVLVWALVRGEAGDGQGGLVARESETGGQSPQAGPEPEPVDPVVQPDGDGAVAADGGEPAGEDRLETLMDEAMRPYAERYWAMVEGTRSEDADVLERSIGQLRGLREEAAAGEPSGDFTLVDDLIARAEERLERLLLVQEFGGMP
ncbi:MAG: hypothetical protein ACF8MJ_10895 [Phycisphaerales bacterium JB050]